MAVIAPSAKVFAKRLNLACDQQAKCPDLNHGRLVWLKDQLAGSGSEVSIESVRKWVSGEARPVQDRATELAKILKVSPTWLYMGLGPSPIAMADKPSQREDDDIVLPIQVRSNVLVKIIGIPSDLTAAEAQRIANIILAHAVVG